MSWDANRRPRRSAKTAEPIKLRPGDEKIVHWAGRNALALVLDAQGRVRSLVAIDVLPDVAGEGEWYEADSAKVPRPRGRPRKET